jgi:hypothetical protein
MISREIMHQRNQSTKQIETQTNKIRSSHNLYTERKLKFKTMGVNLNNYLSKTLKHEEFVDDSLHPKQVSRKFQVLLWFYH